MRRFLADFGACEEILTTGRHVLQGADALARLVVETGTAAAPAGTLVLVAPAGEAVLDGTTPAEAAAAAALLGLVAGAIGVGWRHRAVTADLGLGK